MEWSQLGFAVPLEFAVPLGAVAGVVTTVAGLGGGMLLLAVLSYAYGPLTALTLTAPALLVGNLHRVWLFRAQLDHAMLQTVGMGGFLGALAGGLLAVALPGWVLQACIVGAIGAALARTSGAWSWRPPRRLLAAAGVIAGAISATSGAGVVTGALLWAAGLSGTAYIATASATAFSMHLARTISYGLGGAVTAGGLLASLVLALAIAAGNLTGRAIRDRLTPSLTERAEVSVLVGCAVIAVAGLLRGA
jgi:uncharacterized protein